MIDTDKYVEFLAKHAPSTKKRIYVAETSSGRVQHELWDIAMSSLIEVERLQGILTNTVAGKGSALTGKGNIVDIIQIRGGSENHGENVHFTVTYEGGQVLSGWLENKENGWRYDGAESFEDFKRIMIGDGWIAGDMGYMEGLEEYYNEYLDDFTGDNPESFEDFQERILREDYTVVLQKQIYFTKISKEIDWFMGDKENEAILVKYIPDLIAEVKRLQERLDWILGDEELASYVWEKEVAYMEWEGVRLPWISADEWGEEE